MGQLEKSTSVHISEEDIAQYRENGFARVHNIISKEEAARYAERVMEIYEERKVSGDFGGGGNVDVLRQIVNVWSCDEVMKELTFHPNVLAAVKAFAGVPLRLWHDHILIKDPHNNAPTQFHQDQPYWPHANSVNPISVWIALVDVPVEKGCMSFIPGSQSRDDLPLQYLDDERSLFGICPELEWEPRVTLPLKAGDCTFHHGRCAHMANANATDNHRIAHVAIFTDRDTIYTGIDHAVTTGRGYTEGETLPDEHFPQI